MQNLTLTEATSIAIDNKLLLPTERMFLEQL